MDTVEKFINRLPEEQCDFLLHIRNLILNAHPEMTEKLSFGTPFFTCRGWLAYFTTLDSGGLEIGFTKGHLLSDPKNKLVARSRKLVRSLIFNTPADFDEQLFCDMLNEAVAVNIGKKKANASKVKQL